MLISLTAKGKVTLQSTQHVFSSRSKHNGQEPLQHQSYRFPEPILSIFIQRFGFEPSSLFVYLVTFFLGQFHFVAQELRLLLFPSKEVADLCYHACIIEPFYTKLYMYGQKSTFPTQDQAGSRLVEEYLTFMCAILASISSIHVEGSNFKCFLYLCLPPSFPL